MQISCNARRKLITTSNSQSQPWLWISDDHLQNAYRRFVKTSQCSRRHGSNVPGPLEAQRRLAKRRMVGMTAGGARWSEDLAEVFDGGAPYRIELSWQAPWKSLNKSTTRGSSDSILEIDLTGWLTPPATKTAAGPLTIKQELLAASSLEDIQKLRNDLTFDSPDLELFNNTSFAALLATNPSVDEICGYLFDPILNIADYQNVTTLVERQRNVAETSITTEELIDIVCRALHNGVVSESETQHVIALLSGSSLRPQELANTYTRLWLSLRSSRVVEATKASAKCLLRALDQTVDKSSVAWNSNPDPAFWHTCTQLRSDLYKVLWPLRSTSTIKMRSYVLHWLKLIQCPPASVSSHVLITTKHLARLLAEAPATQRMKVMSAVTKMITTHKTLGSHVTAWLRCLREAFHMRSASMTDQEVNIWRSDLGMVDQAIAAKFSPLQLKGYLESMHPIAAVRAIATHWLRTPQTVTAASAQSPLERLDQHLQKRRYLRNYPSPTGLFVENMDGRQHARQAYIALFIASAHHNQLNSEFFEKIVVLVAYLHGLQSVHYILKSLFKVGIATPPLPRDQIFEDLHSTDPVLYHKLHAFAPAGHMQAPSEYYAKMIEDSSKTRANVWHKIRTDEIASLSKADGSPCTGADHPRSLLMQQAAEMWASKADLPSQKAFRYVYKLFRELRLRQYPIQAPVSRALITAGILRPLQEGRWVSTMRVKQILPIVAELEGEEVADGIDRIAYLWRSLNMRASERDQPSADTDRLRLQGQMMNGSSRLDGVSSISQVQRQESIGWVLAEQKDRREAQREKDAKYMRYVRARNQSQRQQQKPARLVTARKHRARV